jgi:acetyltransferase-like isoleucine patch superfamily enzyme
MSPDKNIFHPIIPGGKIPGDWFSGTIPNNIIVGENTVIDSSFCFKQFFTSKDPGIKIGSNVTLWRTSLAADENGYIEIGDYCYIANASLVSSVGIYIGNRVFIAGGVTVADSNFHPIDPALRLADSIALSPLGNRYKRPPIETGKVIIHDDVWIGFNAAIMKGVTIGAGATIEPGALVISDVAPGITVIGNPAKPVSV